MNYGFLDFLTLIGSLALFLYGMKLMSESLQKVAGDKMRSILSAMTSNRVMGVFTGFLITAAIQSSSATTVMVVSFVNAGLLNLTQSIGVIMGANIGTTITAWLISLLGFKVKISALAIPLIGLGFPLLFSKNNKRKSWGECIVGFSLLFMGLDFLKEAVPDINSNPQILEFLSRYNDLGFGSVLIFLAIGTLLTVIIQSSSATIALTLVMCNNGWISFELAAAMVLGENIGTTITANLAAMIGNSSAKRAALAHLIFNLIGVMWMLCIFYYYLDVINNFIYNTEGASPKTDVTTIPIALSIFHTTFNILNMFFLIWFVKLIEKVVIWIIPAKKGVEEEFKLKHISTSLVSTSELSLLQAKNEIIVFSERVTTMFNLIPRAIAEVNKKEYDALHEKIYTYEAQMDRLELEIADYLSTVAEGELSREGTRRIKAMYKVIDEIESIADVCFNIGKVLEKRKTEKAWFTQDLRDNLNDMFKLINTAFDIMNVNLRKEYTAVTVDKAMDIEEKINNFRNHLRQDHLGNLKEKRYKYTSGIVYSDIFSLCEKVGDHIINVTEAIVECQE